MPIRGPDQDTKPAAQKGAAEERNSFDRKKPAERTLGLKLFDAFLYPGITNIGVFALSVYATYLTSKGGMKNAQGELIHGKIGEFFQKRGDWLINKFKTIGMSHDAADMSKTVFFSFADGTLLAPLVKKFEDNREDIAKSIDTTLGTRPDNDDVYKAEPKQTWGSVLGGRALTALIVVPIAMGLEKTGLNKVMFSDPGKRTGEWITKQPELAKKFGNLDIPEFSKIGFFEAFYTSVCTAGLYVSSRFLVGLWGKGDEANKPRNESAAIPSNHGNHASDPQPFIPAVARAVEPEPKPESKPKHSKPIVVESPPEKPSATINTAHLAHDPSRVHSQAELAQQAGA